MLWQDRAYLAVAGVSTVISIAHYLATAKSVKGTVPIHFDFCGVPNRSASAWAYVLYPLTTMLLGVAVAATTFVPSAAAALPPKSAEQFATRMTLLCSYLAMVGSQLYAPRIAEGSETKLPPVLLGLIYAGVGASLVGAIAAKYLA
ncbi:unspecified product [Leptomonas pyrrhocoris]|uniref:Unspecified product n=1 Tax=Leptomonas pyrrhocoris TaxID=157538 RepID=A0A0N0DZL5_LEPPY|nr:unspecified product [Leptomonas pyrrhocoris]KPA85425.1 unspecified product [Leptomonas pyrrhocoris]|eukprot:XP_015663864.1 unspecified product [Leptomonas pyrrhocoris]